MFTPDGKLLTSGSEQLDGEEDEENSTEDRSERCRSLNTEQTVKMTTCSWSDHEDGQYIVTYGE